MDHCLLLIKLMFRLVAADQTKPDPELLKQLEYLYAKWTEMSDNPRLFNKNLIHKTREVKQKAAKYFSGNKCLPDLVGHMLEELDYFEDSVINKTYDIKKEIAYWAKEHSEGIGFVKCQLPILLAEDGQEMPMFIQNILTIKGDLLKQKLDDLANQAEPGFFSRIFRQQSDDSASLNKLIEKSNSLSEKYLNLIDTLLNNIVDLPKLQMANKHMLVDLLSHEREELLWAQQHIDYY